jgi:lysine-N-methylase
MPTISAPDYYAKFQCIGAQCEDTCCSGWSVSIDQTTYHRYQASTNQVLAPLLQQALHKNTLASSDSANNFALLKMKPDGGCHFQQEDKLCAIQSQLGAQALSVTCSLYPRYLNQFGAQRENALGISCPEAARLILLNPEPMQFGMIEATPGVDDRFHTSYRFPLKNDGNPTQIAVLNDLRAVIIAILQCRPLSLGCRVMTLGFLLEEVNHITTAPQFADAAELLPTLGAFVDMLAQPDRLEAQFAQISPNMPRKLELITALIASSLTARASSRFRDCLQSAAEGLQASPGGDVVRQYADSYHAFYQPFFQQRGHIFENYLVNQVMTRLFPFTRSSYLDLYREMVFNLAILQVLLVGMAAQRQGLNEDGVMQLFQSFARKSDHNSSYQGTLLDSLHATEQDSFVHVMWLLKVAPR